MGVVEAVEKYITKPIPVPQTMKVLLLDAQWQCPGHTVCSSVLNSPPVPQLLPTRLLLCPSLLRNRPSSHTKYTSRTRSTTRSATACRSPMAKKLGVEIQVGAPCCVYAVDH